MADSPLYSQIIEELAHIPEEKLGPLVELVHHYRVEVEGSLGPPDGAEKPKGQFSDLCGVLSPEVADEMLAAIEEEFERIDTDGW